MKDMKTHHCVGLRFLAGAIHRALRANSKDSEKLTHLTRGGGKMVTGWDRGALSGSQRVTVRWAQTEGGGEYKCTVELKEGWACCRMNMGLE